MMCQQVNAKPEVDPKRRIKMGWCDALDIQKGLLSSIRNLITFLQQHLFHSLYTAIRPLVLFLTYHIIF